MHMSQIFPYMKTKLNHYDIPMFYYLQKHVLIIPLVNLSAKLPTLSILIVCKKWQLVLIFFQHFFDQ